MTRWIPPVHPPVGFATSILQTPAWNHSAELVLQLETDGFLFPATLAQPPERLPRGLQPGCRIELVGIAEVGLSDRVRLRGGGPDLFALKAETTCGNRLADCAPRAGHGAI